MSMPYCFECQGYHEGWCTGVKSALDVAAHEVKVAEDMLRATDWALRKVYGEL